MALEGNIDQAVSEFTDVLERFGTESLDPSRLADRYAAQSEVKAGDELAHSGDTSTAATHYQRAVALDPFWRIVPAQRAAEIASWAKVREGDESARNGDLPAAIAAYEQALELYPARQMVPGLRAGRLAASTQVEQGDALARAGNIAGAVAAYQQAIEWDPSQSLDPLAQAQRLAALGLRSNAPDTAKTGNLDQAFADYRRAAEWDANLTTDSDIENQLCWYGSLWNRAADVLPHCERAVAAGPDEGSSRNSRGVARALTGDLQGAAEDFRAYLEWAPANDQPEEMLVKRRQWIDDLESGRNPFDDPATLEALR